MASAPHAKAPADAAAPAASDHEEGGTYFIVRPERMRWVDMLRVALTKRRLRDYPFVETHTPPCVFFVSQLAKSTSLTISPSAILLQPGNEHDCGDETCHPWAPAALAFVRIIGNPWQSLLDTLGFFKTVVTKDRNLLDIFKDVVQGRVQIPDPSSARTFQAFLDPRYDSVNLLTRSYSNYEVPVLAAKIAYEHADTASYLVQNNLRGSEFRFFDCYNVFTGQTSTQAIGFVRRDTDENGKELDVVYVAFRGTEVWDSADWAVNFNCGQIDMGRGWGKVHIGFMQALGLATRTNFSAGFPANVPSPYYEGDVNKPLAYYEIREWLRDVMSKLKWEAAQRGHGIWTPRVRIVGHSQGGALAVFFCALLCYHGVLLPGPDAIQFDLITLGQPRVADTDFADRMRRYRRGARTAVNFYISYVRMVYRDDVVARYPNVVNRPRPRPDNPNYIYASWSHFGTVLYFRYWWCRPTVIEYGRNMPNRNYEVTPDINDLWMELRYSFDNWQGENETLLSLGYRSVGIIFDKYGPGVVCHTLRNYLNAVRSNGRGGPCPQADNPAQEDMG